ncbi:Dolichyl-phosphate-mannose-protein mannosyltransferase-domain-containing protein [Gaertneriomyces semiglobifer]|nr:Dolichyl-phosphate-mannose-protein mannosyltransferase-domain-containing protein [Gaertneriomyces semiglobifer]
MLARTTLIKFAGHYLKQTFYFDVHPPLGKIMNGLAGYVAGVNASFAFESGHTYPSDVNYPIMRIMNALFGAMLVPLAYFTAQQLHMSRAACLLVGCMVLADTALWNISRFILLDSMLLFFTALSIFCLTVFRNMQTYCPFSLQWWFWLFATGISIGAVTSVKWVGLFTIAVVGLHTIRDLWDMLGDLKMPKTKYAQHWAARIAALILTPIAVYLFSFFLHFTILNRSGPGDAHMSSLFQANLRGNNFKDNPLEIAFGSRVTLKNNGHGGGLLHSHVQRYPSGSEQQQVTCYHHKDSNNEWIVSRAWGSPEPAANQTDIIKDGEVIRLVHASTNRNLHSHSVKAPITTSENEVSCYGNSTVGDVNDHWRVEKVDDISGAGTTTIRSLTTRFRLRHVHSGCLLRSHAVNLPEWGFKQAEVLCQKKGDPNSSNNMWNIEQHWNDALPPGGKGAYKSRFLKDVLDLNVAMWTSNNALTPDPDKEDALTSDPWQWPLMLVGLRMCNWSDTAVKFWLIGNPAVWWSGAAGIVVFAFVSLVYLIRWKRGLEDWRTPASLDDYVFATLIGPMGWALHYLPFWIMGRVTYLHHYFPAVYFAIITVAYIVDHLSTRLLPRQLRPVPCLIGICLVIGVGFYFKDFAIGFTGPASAYGNRKWLKSWNLHD